MTTDSTPATDSASLASQSITLLHRFLALVDPPSAALLPSSTSESQDVDPVDNLPIDQWTLLHSSTAPTPVKGTASAASISVRSHPSPNHNLFAVQSVIPGVTARQFWTLMANSCNRDLWDGAVEEMQVKRCIGKELAEQEGGAGDTHDEQRRIADAIYSRVEFLKFGSIFMVAKPRDMVLLSVDARLPSNETALISDDPPLRLVSACTSVPDPAIPPKKGFMRFHLAIGGFMVEDLGSDVLDVLGAPTSSDTARSPGNSLKRSLKGLGRGGSIKRRGTATSLEELSPAAIRITQVSDLGEMASWLPQSIVRMVAQTLVPRSMATIAKIAARMQVPEALKPGYRVDPAKGAEVETLGGAGGEWPYDRALPPMLGQGVLRFDKEIQALDLPDSPSKIRGPRRAPESSSVHRLSVLLREDMDEQERIEPVIALSSDEEQEETLLAITHTMAAVPEEPPVLFRDDESISDNSEDEASPLPAFASSSSSSSLDLASSSTLSDAPAATSNDKLAHGLYGALSGSRFHRATFDLAKLVSSSQPPTPGSIMTPGSLMSDDVNPMIASQEGADYFNRHKTDLGTNAARQEQDQQIVSQHLKRLSMAVLEVGDAKHEVRHEQPMSAGAIATDSPSSVADLLADALGSDLRPSKMRVDTKARRDAKRRETQRMSEFILAGSDALAMALAPGARETLRGEGGTGRRTIILSEEEVGGLDTMFGTSAALRDRTDSSASATTQITERTSGGSTSVTTPGSSSPSMIADIFSGGTVGSRRPSVASTGSRMSPLVGTTVLHAAGYSSSAGTDEREEDERLAKDADMPLTAPHAASRAKGWTASLATAPYALVLGLVSLAWATRHTSSLGEGVAAESTHTARTKKRNPSTSAVEAARAAVALGGTKVNEPNRRQTAPPSGGKKPTTPPPSTRGNASTPPTSSSSSSSTLVFSGLVGSTASRRGAPPIIPADGSAPRRRTRDNYARNDKLHPFPASLGRAAAEGRAPLPDLSPPASPEVMPVGPPLVGALETDARAEAFDLTVAAKEAGVGVAASGLLTPLRWLGSYIPGPAVAPREKTAS